jgi:hypothetical protein
LLVPIKTFQTSLGPNQIVMDGSTYFFLSRF